MPVSEKTYLKLALEDPNQWELHCGQLVRKPGMTFEHNHIATELLFQLRQQLDPHQFELRLSMGHVRRSFESYYIPDIYVIPIELTHALRGRRMLEVYSAPLRPGITPPSQARSQTGGPMATLSVVGQRITRVDGPDKVSGSRVYTADVTLPGALWGKALRSPHPHARILHIDTSAACALPGVHAVLTAADLPPRFLGRRVHDIPLLATDRVRFAGEKIAVVTADDPDVAEEAISLIEVAYEELPAVFDPEGAMRDGAPILHPDFGGYKNAPRVPPIPNVHSHVRWGRGDIEQGFARADRVFEDHFKMPMQHHAFLEPQACVVAVSGGRVRVWTSNKQPFSVKASLADLVDLDPEQITVLPVSIGGDFGGKGSLVDVPEDAGEGVRLWVQIPGQAGEARCPRIPRVRPVGVRLRGGRQTPPGLHLVAPVGWPVETAGVDGGRLSVESRQPRLSRLSVPRAWPRPRVPVKDVEEEGGYDRRRPRPMASLREWP